jgi:hypothetical protein
MYSGNKCSQETRIEEANVITELHYDFVNSLYEEEQERKVRLDERVKLSLSLITFYSAFVIFVVEKSKPVTMLETSIFILTVIAMLCAFLFSLWSYKITNYEAITTPGRVMQEAAATDGEFRERRVADYRVAYERNSKINDDRARWLRIAGYLLLVGIAFHACYFIVKVI